MANCTPTPSMFETVYDPDDACIPLNFRSKFDVRDCSYTTPCWIWTAAKIKGYGTFGTSKNGVRTRWRAHRLTYELFVGPIPEGFELDHLCRHRSCCNPAHLESVTRQVNQLRGYSVSGINARKTHCYKGHPLSGDNLLTGHKGERMCRQCSNDKARRLYHANSKLSAEKARMRAQTRRGNK